MGTHFQSSLDLGEALSGAPKKTSTDPTDCWVEEGFAPVHFQSSAELNQAQFSTVYGVPKKISADTMDCWLTSVDLPPVPFQSMVDLSQVHLSRQPDILVRTVWDTMDCWLTSLALLQGGRILLADFNNGSVKIVDTQTNTVVSKVELSGQPWDLCILPRDRAAITLPGEEEIHFHTKGEVSLQGNFKVCGECRGVAFCDDILILSFAKPVKVELIDMTGKVKRSVDKHSNGEPLFMHPWYLTVTRKGQSKFIYVSDSGTDTITKLSFSLEVLQTFHEHTLRSLHGITTVGDNELLVCGNESNNIVLMDMSTDNITELLLEGAGIEWPYSVAYYPQQKRLFMTSHDYSVNNNPAFNNVLKVFNYV